MKREKIMSRNFYCLFVILPEWVCADMREVTDIRISLNQMKNKIFEMRWQMQDIICELQDMKHLDWAARKMSPGTPGCFHEFTNIISTVSRYGCFAAKTQKA